LRVTEVLSATTDRILKKVSHAYIQGLGKLEKYADGGRNLSRLYFAKDGSGKACFCRQIHDRQLFFLPEGPDLPADVGTSVGLVQCVVLRHGVTPFMPVYFVLFMVSSIYELP
jgi:hypothetical protein